MKRIFLILLLAMIGSANSLPLDTVASWIKIGDTAAMRFGSS